MSEKITNQLAWQSAIDRLRANYGIDEAKSLTNIVFEHFFNLDRVGLATKGNECFPVEKTRELKKVIDKLIEGFPIQYITGKAHFFDLEFLVDQRVLIPRPETEELVQWIIDGESTLHSLNILDIGTGSGCIAISLAVKMKESQVMACDVSREALQVSALNAKSNGVQVNFFQLDILAEELAEKHFDIIVSNPPYIMNKEKALMEINVVEHEPHNALFVPDKNPLLFYEAIAAKAFSGLKGNGKLYLEINENLASETISCLETNGFSNIELRTDFRGKSRMLRAHKI